MSDRSQISDRERDELRAKYQRAVARSVAHDRRHPPGVTFCAKCSFHLNAVERARERAGLY